MNQVATAPFETKWWHHFLEKTNGLKKTSMVKDCMQIEETEQMRSMVLQILKLIIKFRVPHYVFRLFIEGKPIKDKELNRFFEPHYLTKMKPLNNGLKDVLVKKNMGSSSIEEKNLMLNWSKKSLRK